MRLAIKEYEWIPEYILIEFKSIIDKYKFKVLNKGKINIVFENDLFKIGFGIYSDDDIEKFGVFNDDDIKLLIMKDGKINNLLGIFNISEFETSFDVKWEEISNNKDNYKLQIKYLSSLLKSYLLKHN